MTVRSGKRGFPMYVMILKLEQDCIIFRKKLLQYILHDTKIMLFSDEIRFSGPG